MSFGKACLSDLYIVKSIKRIVEDRLVLVVVRALFYKERAKVEIFFVACCAIKLDEGNLYFGMTGSYKICTFFFDKYLVNKVGIADNKVMVSVLAC